MVKVLDTVFVISCLMIAFISLVTGFHNYAENNALKFTLDAILFSTWGVLGAIKLSDLIRDRNNG